MVRPPPDTTDSVAMAWTNAEGKRTADFFHHVVLACHGDQILPIIADDSQLDQHYHLRQRKGSDASLHSISSTKSAKSNGSTKAAIPKGSATAHELEILSAFRTTSNTCYLHSDPALLPSRPQTWSSWNYMINSRPPPRSGASNGTPNGLTKQDLPDSPAGVSLTYDMNILQHIPRARYGHVLVTMNPLHPPRQSLVQKQIQYRHPLYTVEAVRAQAQLESIQNTRGVSYAGAWTKYGFHEDGFSSGLRVAKEHLGAELGFGFVDSTFSRGERPVLGLKDWLVRVAILLVSIVIWWGELVWRIPLVWIPLRIALWVLDRALGFMEEVGMID